MDNRNGAFALGALLLVACGQDTETPGDDLLVEAETAETRTVPWIVASANPMATRAGAEILAQGGSAVDAAVAVQAVLGLVEPQSSGLGGGAFMLHYDHSSGELRAYDGREIAPGSTSEDVFLQDDGTPMGFYEAVTSGFSVGVPGLVAMLDLAHRNHGALDWSALFEPAITLAEDGFPMPERLHGALNRFVDVRKDPGAEVYLRDGVPIPLGELVTHPAYAETARTIAEGGAGAFYSGDIAEAIIERVNRQTGELTMTQDDFFAYAPEVREPICREIRQYKICSMPPPSSGGVTMLQIVSLYERAAGEGAVSRNLLPYLEAVRLAYADRNRYLADPTAIGLDDLSAEDLVDALVSDEYLDGRAEEIGSEPADEVAPGNPAGALLRDSRIDGNAYELPSTSHFSIRDSRGNIVSMTTTVEFGFGSQMMAAGMVLNNQLTDFARQPRQGDRLAANAPGPYKRPLSSMAPTIVFDENGEPYAAIGSPGGRAIITYVAKPLIQHIFAGIPLSEAITMPHIAGSGRSFAVETGAEELAAAVEAYGFDVRERDLTSGLYGFALPDGEVDLVVDSRREGSALTSESWQP